jgi:hypothetical protein
MFSVAEEDGVLRMAGVSFTELIKTVPDWCAHRFGVPRSQTSMLKTQLDGGVGPAGMNQY